MKTKLIKQPNRVNLPGLLIRNSDPTRIVVKSEYDLKLGFWRVYVKLRGNKK